MTTSLALIIAISPFMVAVLLIPVAQKTAEAQESGNRTKYPDMNEPDLDSNCNKQGCVLKWLDCYEAIYQCKKWKTGIKHDNMTEQPSINCGRRDCTCKDAYRMCGTYTRGCNVTNDCFVGKYQNRFPLCVQQKVRCLGKLVDCFLVEGIPFLVHSNNPAEHIEYMDSNACVRKFVDCGDQEQECGRTSIIFTKPLSNLTCKLTKDWSENIAEWEFRENYFKSEENAEVFVSRDKKTSDIMLNMELPHQEANFTLIFKNLNPKVIVQVCQPAGSICADAPGMELEIASIDARCEMLAEGKERDTSKPECRDFIWNLEKANKVFLHVKSSALPSGCRLNMKIVF